MAAKWAGKKVDLLAVWMVGMMVALLVDWTVDRTVAKMAELKAD
jgi:hypothetical protein